jgi:hypothetical protein
MKISQPIPLVILVAVILVAGCEKTGTKENPPQTESVPDSSEARQAGSETEEVHLGDAETESYTEEFWKQYDEAEVRKQVRISLGMALTNDPELEIPVSMHGPNFYRDKATGKVFGMLSIGFTAFFRVDFESPSQTETSFVDGVTGTWRPFKSYEECRSFSSNWIDEQLASAPQPSSDADEGESESGLRHR